MVILDRENDRIHQLNATATLVWHRLGDRLALADIANELVDRYDVSREVALADVRRVLEELRDLDLIVWDVSRD